MSHDIGEKIRTLYSRIVGEPNQVCVTGHIAGAVVGLLLGNVLLRLNTLKSYQTWKKAIWWFSILVFLVLFIGIISINIGYGRSRKLEDDFAESFRKIDIDKDGLITGDDLRSTVKLISDLEVNSIIDEADLDGGGMINFKEWTAYMTNKMDNKKFVSTR